MATTDLIGAQKRTRTTALPLEIRRAAARYEAAVERKAALDAKPTASWSGADFDAWADSERTILDSVTTLALAGHADLIEADVDPVIRAAADFRKAALRAANLSNLALSPEMLTLHADDLAHAEDLMAGARAELKAAGMLRLIGGA